MLDTTQTVFIIDDEPEVSEALQWLFESVGIQVKAYTNAYAFLEQYHANMRGCLISDVRMPGMSGLELIEKLKEQNNLLPVIIITGYGDVPMAIRAMKAGAIDFILKPVNDQNLLEIVQQCLNQSTIQSTWVKEISARIQTLTEREIQVIELIIEGKLNKEIGYELSISRSTVEAHRASIMKKMKAKNLAQLINMYVRFQMNEEFRIP
ncbi:two component response regulator PilR [Legionella rubrilucens]|uniref:Two component response regulator PilR n=2 Tax=Legionella rubrilucens TaxID=458 RepID=A0A0W0XLZ8_9GAMM|nr:response regulator [Legionella rubrilucens]KTD45615.1 two component response regulator PilR [Legionella rubrilucens]